METFSRTYIKNIYNKEPFKRKFFGVQAGIGTHPSGCSSNIKLELRLRLGVDGRGVSRVSGLRFRVYRGL